MTDQKFKVRKDGKYLIGFINNDEAHPLMLADGEHDYKRLHQQLEDLYNKLKGERDVHRSNHATPQL